MEDGQNWKSTPELVLQGFEQILVRLNDESYTSGLDTGFKDLNSVLCGLQRGQVVLLGGRPAMGKSALMQNIILNVAQNGHGVGVFSLASSAEQFSLRLISIESSVSISKIRTGRVSKDIDLPEINGACARLNTLPIFVQDGALTVDDIRNRAHTLKLKQGNLELIVVDYIGLLQGTSCALTSAEAIAEASHKLKLLAIELDVCVLVLSQLNRRLERRMDKRPILSDLRGSSSLEHDADVVCFIYRDEYYNENTPLKGEAEVIIAKQRNGPTGTVLLQFDGPHLRFRSHRSRRL